MGGSRIPLTIVPPPTIPSLSSVLQSSRSPGALDPRIHSVRNILSVWLEVLWTITELGRLSKPQGNQRRVSSSDQHVRRGSAAATAHGGDESPELGQDGEDGWF